MHNGNPAAKERLCCTALLLVDVINDMDFDGSEALPLMSKVVNADITPSTALDLRRLQ